MPNGQSPLMTTPSGMGGFWDTAYTSSSGSSGLMMAEEQPRSLSTLRLSRLDALQYGPAMSLTFCDP